MPVNRIVLLCGGVLAVGLFYCGLRVQAAGANVSPGQAEQAQPGYWDAEQQQRGNWT